MQTNDMRQRPEILLILVTLCLLASCASVSKSDCETGDWERIGENDGDFGRSPDYFERHLEACAKHGVTPDKEAYELGYSGGLADYCSRRGGYEAGKRGSNYKGVCSEGYEEDFRIGYNLGRELYQVASEIAEDAARLRQLDNELRQLQINHNRDSAQARQREERRRYLLTQIIRLEQRISRNETDLRTLEKRAEKTLLEQ